jgi:hypothetical protein
MKINLTTLQREIGSVSRLIDSEAATADHHERAAEFCLPKSPQHHWHTTTARKIRRVSLPQLFTRLHRLEAKLPAPEAIEVSTFDALLARLDHQNDERRRELTRAAALAKLTPAERHALGVIAA